SVPDPRPAQRTVDRVRPSRRGAADDRAAALLPADLARDRIREARSPRMMRVTVIGAGYVGAVSAAVLAYLGHRVTCVEHDVVRCGAWRSGRDPPGEPGLAEPLRC